MAFEFKFPDVGEGINEGRLIKWLIKAGDTIKEDQPIAEVETDKAVVEIPAPKSGVVKQLLYNEKDIMPVGKTIMIIDTTSGQDSTITQSPSILPTPITREPQIQQVPPARATSSMSFSPGTAGILAMPNVRRYAREQGITLTSIRGSGKNGRILLSDLQGKPSGERTARTFGRPLAATVKPTSTTEKLTTTTLIAQKEAITTSFKDILATPSTKKLARELGINITTLMGTGRNRSITPEDVQRAADSEVRTAKAPITAEHLEAKPATIKDAHVKREPLSMMRLAIANKMMESKTTTAAVTHMDEADVTDIVALREKEKEVLAKKGVKLTFLPFFMKATIIGLKNHPHFNAEIDMQRREVILKSYYNLGIATDTPEGLLVPVIQEADQKSIVELAKIIDQNTDRARKGTLGLDEMSHGTFTITSIGSIGGMGFTPIINTPQVAILGIGKIMDKPVARAGVVMIRKMVTLSVTYDHRLLDGGEAARFLATIIQHLEDPSLLFLEMD